MSKEREVFSKNLQYFIEQKGIDQRILSNYLGISEMSVSNWVNGLKYPRMSNVQKMADYFGINKSDLIEEKEDYKIKTSSSHKFYPDSISAGLPLIADGVTDYETISIPDQLMGKYAGHDDIIVSKINGDSMDKLMNDGSFIAIKPVDSAESLNNGDIVVFSHNHEYSVKYFYKHDDMLVFKPYSNNPVHYDQSFNIDDGVLIHGKVVTYIVNLD